MLLTYLAAPAQDHPLAALRATLVSLRSHANDHGKLAARHRS